MKELIKKAVLRVLVVLRLYPHPFLVGQPGKIYEYYRLLKGVKFTGSEVVLDFGCGAGMQTVLLGSKCAKVVGIDINKASIARANKTALLLQHRVRSEFLSGRIEHLGLEESSFDKVFSFCVIEHVPNYEEVFQILYNVLKPGGELIFSADSMEAFDNNEIVDQHRAKCSIAAYFRKDTLEQLLKETGFTDISIEPSYQSKYAQRLWLRVFKKDFKIGVLQSVFGYLLVRYHEARCSPEEKGLFLMVKCQKRV